uniref:Novel immune-type receptor 2 n=1 Tax=Miichthys miiuy TaxID=240162 RepID=U3PY95_MIIMI|nr:novel immune-type receptor 2 [Miichthys miiuy]
MKNFILMTALSLCSFGQIFISYSESQTVEVQPGENVTLLSKNISKYEAVTFWFRLDNRTKANCISVMINFDKVEYCKTFQSGRFQMGTNVSTVFLNIQKVDLSDSGLYFCAFYIKGRPSFNVIQLNVKGSNEPHDGSHMDSKIIGECDRATALMGETLGSLIVFLLVVIVVLVVKNRKLQRAASEEQEPQQDENLVSGDLKDADLSLCAETIRRRRRPESEREVETRVIYVASRQTHWN